MYAKLKLKQKQIHRTKENTITTNTLRTHSHLFLGPTNTGGVVCARPYVNVGVFVKSVFVRICVRRRIAERKL